MTSKQKDQAESNIQTFLRIRPSKIPSGFFFANDLDKDTLTFSLPENYKNSDYINNSKSKYSFHFNGIIEAKATQDEVFKRVGTAAVQNAIDGFNSTIFAYGQTGSGKTFTLTGGPEKYADRGLIPRSISMLFNEFRTRTDVQFKAYISYLELYNEQGYDLLDPSHETKSIEDLPRVSMLEDEHGNFHLKNLSMHPAETEEDALNLLFMGDTNRAIAETPMNMASSRSHCIFTIAMESRIVGSEKVRRSKLHLVDLAGSERVAKTNSSGSVLTEAKYINSSLFFLEMVIVALYEKATKGRSHIPYRNSMMTSVLRDSLGGNCKTIMIATINPEASHTEESLSTCRFAQRVSLIKNKATINEDADPMIVIRRLKNEILNLREEISFLKGESGEGDVLSPQELDELKTQCKAYCSDMDPYSVLNIGPMTLTKIKDAFAIMKNLVLESRAASESNKKEFDSKEIGNNSIELEKMNKQISDLKSSLVQRENEIAILVNMVKKGKTIQNVNGTLSQSYDRGDRSPRNSMVLDKQGISRNSSMTEDPRRLRSDQQNLPGDSWQGGESNHSSKIRSINIANEQREQQMMMAQAREKEKEERIVKKHLFGVPPPADPRIFEDAAASFEWFRERCSLNNSMEENKEILRQKITEAKNLGERANQSRSTITYLKNSIEAIRRERALLQMDSGAEETEETPEEKTHRRAIEQEKSVYKESLERLRTVKPEIDHIKKIMEKCRTNMQVQFDQWYNNLHGRTGIMLLNAVSQQGQSEHIEPAAAKQTKADNSERGRNDRLTESKLEYGGNSLDSKVPQNQKDQGGDVNEDILAFYQAKEELLKRRAGH